MRAPAPVQASGVSPCVPRRGRAAVSSGLLLSAWCAWPQTFSGGAPGVPGGPGGAPSRMLLQQLYDAGMVDALPPDVQVGPRVLLSRMVRVPPLRPAGLDAAR